MEATTSGKNQNPHPQNLRVRHPQSQNQLLWLCQPPEFGSIQTEVGRWKQRSRGRIKTRTLKIEGCGTLQVKTNCTWFASRQNSDRFRLRWEGGSSDFEEESKPAPLKPKGAAPPKSKTNAKASPPAGSQNSGCRFAVFDHRKEDGTEETRDWVGEVTQRISPGPR